MGDGIVDLDQPASLADPRVERVDFLPAGLKLRLGQIGVGKRLLAQVDQIERERGTAETADRFGHQSSS